MEYYLAVKNEIMKFAGWSVKNHAERGNQHPERQIWYAFVYMWILVTKSMMSKLQSVESKSLDME